MPQKLRFNQLWKWYEMSPPVEAVVMPRSITYSLLWIEAVRLDARNATSLLGRLAQFGSATPARNEYASSRFSRQEVRCLSSRAHSSNRCAPRVRIVGG
jgi:hypothetical protein